MKRLSYILIFLSLQVWGQQSAQKMQSIDDYFYDAMTERLKENYSKSNKLFEQCLAIAPDNDAVLFKIAQNYFDLKDYDQSLTYLAKAQKLNPKNKWYQKLFIEIKIKQQVNSKTLIKLIQDFEKKAGNPYVIRDLYNQLYTVNQSKNIKKNKPLKPAGSDNLEQLWQQKDYKTLIKKAETLLDTDPANAKAYLYMSKALTALKKYQEALDYLDMGMDFIESNSTVQKEYYRQYITIYAALNLPAKAKIYQQKLHKN